VTPVKRAQAAGRPDDRQASLLAVAVLALLAMQVVRLAGRPAQAPRALGGAARRHPAATLDEPAALATPRGVGRFRTVRPRPPVQI
jgi:hypothetical protein